MNRILRSSRRFMCSSKPVESVETAINTFAYASMFEGFCGVAYCAYIADRKEDFVEEFFMKPLVGGAVGFGLGLAYPLTLVVGTFAGLRYVVDEFKKSNEEAIRISREKREKDLEEERLFRAFKLRCGKFE